MDFFINILKFLKDCLAAFLEFIVNFNVKEFLESCQKNFQTTLLDPNYKYDSLISIGATVYSVFLLIRVQRLKDTNKEIPRKLLWMLWLSPIVMFVGAYFIERSPGKTSICFFNGICQFIIILKVAWNSKF
ncbi:hypothetical protein FACS1894204_01630 [Synergistales bacterium]|nr:hypothetical protein FACS1894204_01630 [Synergistales bacterium]